MKVRWSPLALQQLSEIVEFIARDKPEAAEQWADEVFDLVETLAASPHRGRVVPEVKRLEIRELLHGNYRIIYKVGEGMIGVLSVRSAARLLASEDFGKAESGV